MNYRNILSCIINTITSTKIENGKDMYSKICNIIKNATDKVNHPFHFF